MLDYKDSRFKLLKIEKKQDDDGSEIAEFEGYGSVFDNEDLGRDIVERGAFTKTTQENPEVPLLWQHWPDEVIGLNVDLHEDGKGLRLKGVINLAVEKGREAYALLKQGAVRGLSIGYEVVKYQIEELDGGDYLRRLQEIKLWEVSLVTFPMNQLARVEVVKARQNGTAADIDEIVRKALDEHVGVALQKALESRAEEEPGDEPGDAPTHEPDEDKSGVDPAEVQSLLDEIRAEVKQQTSGDEVASLLTEVKSFTKGVT